MTQIYWLRSDLRLQDNPALVEFVSGGGGLIVWCKSRSQERARKFRASFLWENLLLFKREAEAIGAQVLIFDQDVRAVFPKLCRDLAIGRIVYSDEAGTEEKEDEAFIQSLGCATFSYESLPLMKRHDLPFDIEALPEVFTNFRKKIERDDGLTVSAPLPPPTRIPSLPSLTFSLPFLSDEDVRKRITHRHPKIRAGERGGLDRLSEYLWELDRLKTYKDTRNGLLDWNDSSKLSPWLATGALSARTVYAEILRYENERIKNESTYWLVFELLWRDYFHWISEKWGARLFTGMNSAGHLEGDKEAFQAWCEARTGQTFIDAHMRELNETGFMSNRGRQNVANYLVKTMGGDWRKGAAYFEEQLIDYDPSSNWGNWAYQAGTGQDPRNRKFDPEHQASLYDPEGLYQKKWSLPVSP